MAATIHRHKPHHWRALLTLGLSAVIGLAVLAAPKLERGNVPETAQSNIASCETDPTVSPIPANRPPAHERGLHRVNSPIPASGRGTTTPLDTIGS